MNHPPGLQLLHCLKSSCKGGESVFADAFEATHEIYNSQRESFDALASFPVSFHYRAPNKTYFDTKPVIELDPNIDAMRQVNPSADVDEVLFAPADRSRCTIRLYKYIIHLLFAISIGHHHFKPLSQSMSARRIRENLCVPITGLRRPFIL